MKPQSNFSDKYLKLFSTIFNLYHLPENKNKLLFHGWHHIKFVHDKAIEFAIELEADQEVVAVSALLHDLNYMFTDKMEPEAAKSQIISHVLASGYSQDYANNIATTIENSHIAYRGDRQLSLESQSLADADTVFKILPTNPILLSSKFITQNKYDIEKLANKIINEQKPLIDQGIYFYTKIANEKYLKWAKNNLELWEYVLEALKDDSVKEMLKTAYELEVL